MATYTSAGTGLWSAGATWVGGVKPPSAAGHKIVIAAGHTVTYDEASGEYGDDTSSLTTASNAIVVNGTLAFSQTMSTELICRGTLAVASGGKVTCGTSAAPLPTAYTCKIRLNYSTSMASGKHGFYGAQPSTTPTYEFNGKTRKRNAKLTAGTSGGATTIIVDDATGWEVGDRLAIESDTSDVTRAQIVTIQAGYTPGSTTVPVSAITYARSIGCYVGNLTSNVIFAAHTAANPSFVAMYCLGSSTMTFSVSNVRFENIGNGTGWTLNNRPNFYGLSVGPGATPTDVYVDDCAFEHDNTAAQTMSAMDYLSLRRAIWRRCAFYTVQNTSSMAFYAGSDTSFQLDDCVIYRSYWGVLSGYGPGASDGDVNNCKFNNSYVAFYPTAGTFGVNNVVVRSAFHCTYYQTGVVTYNNCDITTGGQLDQRNPNAGGRATYNNCKFNSTALTTAITGNIPKQACRNILVAVDSGSGVTLSDNRVKSYWQETVTDTTTRLRSTYAVKIKNNVAGTATTYTFTIPAVSGVAQTIKPALRWDTNYVGSGLVKPVLTLSGQGVSQSFTPSGSSVDTWYDTTLTYTPTSTGDITVTVTVQSSNTTGFAWLDGLYHYPMTQSVRHFGYQFLPQTALVADSTITLSEAAALALPVAVNHGTSTITISGNCTTREIYEACIADLCATANQGQVEPGGGIHITPLLAGDSFSTTYNISVNTGCTITGNFTTSGTVTLTGTATVAGVYTSSAGQSTYLTLTGLTSSAVAVYNGSGVRQQFSSSVTGTYALSIAPGQTGTWSWKVARYGYLPATSTFAPNTGAVTAAVALQADTAITQATSGTVAAYSSLDSPDQMYDYLAYWETQSAGIDTARQAVKSGAALDFGAKSLVLDATAASLVGVVGSTVTLKAGTVVAGTTMQEITATGAAISLQNGASLGTIIYTDANGRSVRIVAASLVSGSRVQLYNVTNSAELLNSVLGGAGLATRVIYTADKTIRLRADHADKLALETLGILGSNGLTFLDSQVDDDVYTGNAIDGSTVTEFAADEPNVQIDVDDGDGVTSVQRLYAWFQYWQTTSAGVASSMFGAITAQDAANYAIDQARANVKFHNVSGRPVIIAGGYLYRLDGSTVIAATSGSIQMDPGRAYIPASEASATAAAVWAAGARTLTADPGAAAHATTQAAIAALPAPLDAAGTRAAVGLAAANLDTQLAALPTDADVQAAAAAALTAYDAATGTDVASAQAALVAEHDATQSAIAALPAAPSAAAIRAEMDANSTKLANLDATVSSRLAAASYAAPLDAAGTRAAVGLAAANLDAQLAALPTDADVQAAAAAAVAAAEPVAADVRYVNGIQVDGSGTALDPWGPV